MTGYHAILLAAGAGRRFGGGKLAAIHRGAPLLAQALAKACAAPVDGIIVALGADAERLRPLLFPSATIPIRIIEVPDWAEGMSASLKAAIRALPETSKGAFIFLGDMPDVPVELCPAMIAAVEQGAPAALPDFKGQPGHPVLLSAALYPEVLALEGDRGAGAILARLGNAVARLDAPAGAVFDIDRRGGLR